MSAARPLLPLALYVHLPWCIRKCPYCDFNSHEATRIPEKAYITTLIRDLEAELPLLEGRQFSSVFVGGGTPSLFSGQAMARLLARLRGLDLLQGGAEITLEANPGTAEQARFRAYFEAGINRLSIGIQSFQNEQLQALGRIHDRREGIAAFHMARRAGFQRINMDLMHGLPAQNQQGALDDLRQAIVLAPEHISWYQLTIEPNTRFWSTPPVLPDEDTLAGIEQQGALLLEDAGYHSYEISAWCQPREESLHNLNYWTFGDYVGIGAGAHGKLTLADGRVIRTRKTRKPDDYLRADFSAQRLQETVEAERLPLEFLMNHLRIARPFTAQLFLERTGMDIACITPGLRRARELGLLREDALQPTDTGRRYLNDLLGLFD